MYEDFRPRLTVDLGALRRNLKTVRQLRPQAELMPVVKADCYGLGAEQLLPVMMEEDCSTFFVAYPEEATVLRRVATTGVFYVFGAAPGTGPYNEHCRPLHYRADDLRAWSGGSCGVQIEIGMNRLGMRLDELEGLEPREDVKLVLAHMSDASDEHSARNEEQRTRFDEIVRGLQAKFPKAKFSLSSTGNLMLEGVRQEDAVRPGIGLYGASPGTQDPLEPIATLEARVLSVHDVPAGERVGYGGRWTAERPSVIATLGTGYADGLPRSLENSGKVWLGNGQRTIVGAVSMDLITVDVTDAPGVKVGEWAEIFGPNLAVDALAREAGTIGYELFTSIHGRTQRVYTSG
ncbi:alanine racemase [Parvularcula lutaonensis]|uniref:Alanine racemase n=1 Tax=Parvularcula lutaonensis TaxID=491923 RepID=A0ABV7M7Y9_9PROT|nr:alanine racemase [Parvularcula lutaonensis]GGY42907.1 alanine racemase [Parvularcula lutaonensis]